MNIGIIGFGRMGNMIKQIAESRGHIVTDIIDPKHKEATASEISAEITAEVLIDFSTPNSVLGNIQKTCNIKKNIIVGTTGWTEDIEEVEQQVKNAGIGFLWGSNFSPAVQMFLRTVRAAAKISNKLPESDIGAWEAHHKHKLDSPSGTALTMGEILLEEIDRKTELLLDRPERKIQESDLHLATIRTGEIPGTHCALFDFPAETIEVKCTSRSREGFALGAVIASEWLEGKSGFYDFSEIFDDIIGIAS